MNLIIEQEFEEMQKKAIETQKHLLIERENFNIKKSEILDDFKKDNNGKINLIENEFLKILNLNHEKVKSVDKNYIHQFIKVSNFIDSKKNNIQKMFKKLNGTENEQELIEQIGLLKNQINSYEIFIFHSLNMLSAVISDDIITFYQIYEKFDKFGMFNSDWENNVTKKLANIEIGLNEVMYSINGMERKIVQELSNLNYTTQESFKNLNNNLSSQLIKIGSSLDTKNLLMGIQTYQLYKINKQTKNLLT